MSYAHRPSPRLIAALFAIVVIALARVPGAAQTVPLDVPIELLEPMRSLIEQAEDRLGQQAVAPPVVVDVPAPAPTPTPTGKTWTPGERFVLGQAARAVTILPQGGSDKLPGGYRADVAADDDISDMLDWAQPGPHYAIVVGLDGKILRPTFTVLAGAAASARAVAPAGQPLTHDAVQAMLDRGGVVELPAGATIRTTGFVLRRSGTTVTTAGDGPRARIVLQLDGGPASAFSVVGDERTNIGIDRLDLSVEGRDGGRLRAAGFTTVESGASGIFVTNCVIAGFADGVVMQGLYEGQDYLTQVIDPVVAPVIRGNVIRDIYSGHGNGHSQGIFANSTVGLHISGNVIYRTGWAGDRDSQDAPATPFNQGIYIYSTCVDTRVEGNVVLQASSHGLQLRGGGWAAGNYFAQTALGVAAYGETVEVSGNIIDRCGDISAIHPRGLAIEHKLVGLANTRDNIAQNKTGAADWYGFVEISDNNWKTTTDGVQRNGVVNVTGNLIYSLPAAGWVNLPVQNNNERLTTTVTGAGNIIDDPAWSDPGRTLPDYVRQVMGQAIADDEAATVWFVEQAQAGDARAAAGPLNAWIRGGYERGPPADAPAPVPTPAEPEQAADAAPTVELIGEWGRWQGMPLVVRLHGRGGGNGWRADAVARSADGRELIAERSFDADQLTVWMADPTDATAWLDQDLMLAMIREIERVAGTERRVIRGISMGGGGAFRLARLAHAAGMTFDALRMDTPALLHSGHTDHLGGLAGNQRAGDIDPDGLEFDPAAFRAVWLTNGGRDESISPASVRELRGVFEARGVNVTYWEDPAGGHEAWRDAPAWFTDGWAGAIQGN